MNTDAAILIAIAIAIVAAVVIAVAYAQRRRSQQMRAHYGAEYIAAVDELGDRRRAEAALKRREKRVEAFHIRPLTPQEADRFASRWRRVQAEFVDDPRSSIGDADELRSSLAEVRENRYAITPRSLTMAAGSVAAPIVNADGEVEAAVGMVYLVERDDPQRFVELVRSTASRISRSLLQRPGPPSPASVVFLRRESSPD